MSLIASAAFIFATQIPSAAPDRTKEIWDHVENRFINQADIWFDLGEFPLAVSLLKVHSASVPDDYEVMSSLGWMLENIQKKEEARSIYAEYSNRNPNDGDAAFALGFSYYNDKDWDNTIKILEPTLTKNASPNTYRVLAKSYERKSMYKDAIRIWELELKKFPGEPTAIANIKRVKAKIASGGK